MRSENFKLRWPRASLGIQARLVILTLATVLPLVALAGFAILRTVDDQRRQIERDVRERVASLLAAVDREISNVQISLKILGRSPSLQAGDLAAFAAQLRQALEVQGLAIGLHDTNAEELVATTRPYGELPPRQTNREMVARIAGTGAPHVSNLFNATALQRAIVTVGVPVFRDGRVAYVLTMALDPAHLSSLLTDQNIPSDWTVGIIDRKGVIVARNRDLDRFFGQPVTPALRERIAGAAEEGWFSNVTSDGQSVYAAFRRSPITGWTVVIGIPRGVVDGPVSRAYWLAAGGGAAALAVSLVLAWWMAQTIRRPVHSLTAAARALGTGGASEPTARGVREFDEVGNALRSTAEALERRARERETAEAALRDSEERFRTLIEALPQLVWSCLPSGECDYLSRQWLDYTGIPEAEQVGLRWLEAIHPEDRERIIAARTAAGKGRRDYDLEYRIRAADGSYRWFKTRGVPVCDGSGRIVKWFGTCTDIQDIVGAREMLARSRAELEAMVAERTHELAATNERLRTEIEARAQAQAALLQAQKMEVMGQLTGGIAHDFNNLLTIMSGSLEMLEGRIAEQQNLRLLRTAQDAAIRGAKLTESLLAFARKQLLEPVAADLNTIIGEMSEMLRRSLGASVEIRYTLTSKLWLTLVDVSQIQAAVLNIAINARDAMPAGGLLTIETAKIPAGSKRLPSEVAGLDCILVSVSDTGTGMSPEVMRRAFEPFFTTKERGQGTGLGLSMVLGVVRQSGGAVRLRANLGEGTTVQIFLPRAAEVATPLKSDLMPIRGGRGETAKILVVDDDADVRWVTVESLRHGGHLVVEAENGHRALQLLERGDPCDLVVMDVVMPGLSGTETMRLARQTRPDLKVVFVTGHADKFVADGHFDDALIKKPFKPGALAEAVRSTLDGGPGRRRVAMTAPQRRRE